MFLLMPVHAQKSNTVAGESTISTPNICFLRPGKNVKRFCFSDIRRLEKAKAGFDRFLKELIERRLTMKITNNHFSMSRVLQSARFFLLPMILSALISFSGAVSSVSAQTTGEVCRETQKVIEQYQQEEQEATTNAYYKNNEEDMHRNLSILNKAISNGTLLSDRNLGVLAQELFLTLPKEAIRMTPEERSAFQRQARSILVQKIQELSGFTLEELDQKVERIQQQLGVRRERFKALNCDEVLSRNKVTLLNVSGTWDFECCDKKYTGKLTLKQDGNTITGNFGETTNGTTGNIKGQINGNTLTFERKWDGKKQNYVLTLSADGKTLTGNFSGDRNPSAETDVRATRP